jgi:hypothetical protein
MTKACSMDSKLPPLAITAFKSAMARSGWSSWGVLRSGIHVQ